MNKNILFLAIIFFCMLYACNSSDSKAAAPPANVGMDSANFTQVKWMDTAIDFGTVTKGQKVHISYKCKNIGNKPLFIYYVRPGCGCTVADYTKAAIAPGSTGEVDADFDSNHGNPGSVRKSIKVQTNTINASPYLIFTGTVLDKAASESPKKSS